MKQGVAAQLARIRDPVLRYAIVFDSDRWHPVQPPAGSEWDYEPFISLEKAREALADPGPGMSNQEIWEKRKDGWCQIEEAVT